MLQTILMIITKSFAYSDSLYILLYNVFQESICKSKNVIISTCSDISCIVLKLGLICVLPKLLIGFYRNL